MSEKETSKKPYETPRLTILARGNPEEAVLAGCKYTAKAGASAGNNACALYATYSGCGWGDQQGGGGSYCYSVCSAQPPS